MSVASTTNSANGHLPILPSVNFLAIVLASSLMITSPRSFLLNRRLNKMLNYWVKALNFFKCIDFQVFSSKFVVSLSLLACQKAASHPLIIFFFQPIKWPESINCRVTICSHLCHEHKEKKEIRYFFQVVFLQK